MTSSLLKEYIFSRIQEIITSLVTSIPKAIYSTRKIIYLSKSTHVYKLLIRRNYDVC